jgi:hypothetical protein
MAPQIAEKAKPAMLEAKAATKIAAIAQTEVSVAPERDSTTA